MVRLQHRTPPRASTLKYREAVDVTPLKSALYFRAISAGTTGREELDLVQAALLDDHVLPNDEPVGGHLAQLRQNAVDVLVGIDEGDHDGQLASRFHEGRGVCTAAAEDVGAGV